MNKSIKTIINHNLYYYCSNNNTTKLSDNGKWHSIYKVHIKYDKDNNNYYFMNEHSSKFNIINIIYKNELNGEADIEFKINLEIKIYDNFKDI